MEDGFRIMLLSIAALISIFLVIEWVLRRKRRMVREIAMMKAQQDTAEKFYIENATKTVDLIESTPAKQEVNPEDLIVLSVMAFPGSYFESYDLFQAISTAGLKYGAMNIFHYYVPTAKGEEVLFSLASATKPGVFNLDKMGDFSCVGLTLFTHLRGVSDAEEAFETMLATAEQLADDLEGELRMGQTTPFTEEIYQQLQEKISHYKSTLWA